MRASSVAEPKHQARLHRAVTDLVLDVFRLNGELLAAGNALVGDLGLSSARWQLLGSIALSPVPLPVAHLARNMGLTRQAVQRSVAELRGDGLVSLADNPHHRRAMLVVMTNAGQAAYQAALARQEGWAGALAAGLSPDRIEAAASLLRELQQRLRDAAAVPADIPMRSNPERSRHAEIRRNGHDRSTRRSTGR